MLNVAEITIVCSLFLGAISMTHYCPNQSLCKCKYYGNEVDLYCIGTGDLSDLKKCLIENFQNFTIRSVYLKNCNATSLPSSILGNLTVKMLYLRCPILNFSKDAFVGIYRFFLQLRLYNSELTAIPDAFGFVQSLQRLWISKGTLESLGEQLRNLTNLKILSLRENRIKYVSPKAFISLVSLLELYLSDNLIKHIVPEAFISCKNLKAIVMTNNRLMSAEGLLDFMNPKVILLQDNRLTDVHIFHSRMWRTTEIDLSDNPVGKIDNSVFRRYFVNLQTLTLSKMNLTDVAEDAFTSISSLDTLDLSKNELEIIHRNTFNKLIHMTKLDISQNKLWSINGVFTNLVKMTMLDVSGNQIVELGNSLDGVPDLKTLHVYDNNIQALTDENFRISCGYKAIVAQRNNISYITKDCFRCLVSLVAIDLSSNNLVSLNGSIRNLPNLSKIHLAFNRIETLHDDDFANVPQLKYIALMGNRLSALNKQFMHLNLEYLNLRDNKFFTLSEKAFPNIMPISTLLMEGNPLVCDCRLKWLSEWTKKYTHYGLRDQPVCVAPVWLKGRVFKNLSISDLMEWKASCPSPCKCFCQAYDVEMGIKVNCADNNLTEVPEIFPSKTISLDISGNNLTSFSRPPSNSSLFKQLIELNVENNHIKSIQGLRLLRNLSVFKMANNCMETIDVDAKANFSLVTLSGNPWLCDCSTLWFRSWLFTLKDEILDINQTKCAKGNVKNEISRTPIIYLSEDQICPPKVALYILISIGILGFLLLVSSSAVTYYRYNLNIKIWLYSHGFTCVKEDDVDKDKKFDAFVSYCSYDEKFVHRILRPTLENGTPAFDLCIHERNFPASNEIQLSIIAAVKASRRTILVLSRNFLESEWCTLEFRTAHAQALEDKINRLIIIVYGEMPPEEYLDEEMKAYLKSSTYLRWGEKYFWQKLRYALPKVKKKRERVPLHYDETVDLLIGY